MYIRAEITSIFMTYYLMISHRLVTVASVVIVVHCTVYSTVYSVYYTLYSTLYNVQCTVYNVQCTLYSTVYTVHCTVTSYTVHRNSVYYKYYYIHLTGITIPTNPTRKPNSQVTIMSTIPLSVTYYLYHITNTLLPLAYYPYSLHLPH